MTSTQARILLRGFLAFLLDGMPSDPFLLIALLPLLLSVHPLEDLGKLKYLIKFRLRYQTSIILFLQNTLKVLKGACETYRIIKSSRVPLKSGS